MDLTVFGKLRKIASLEGIATFAALNDNLYIAGVPISNSKLSNIVSLGDGSKVEYSSVFGRMANTEEIIKLAISSIEPVENAFASMLSIQTNNGNAVTVDNGSLKNTLGTNLAADKDSVYQLKTSGSNVFVVAGNGFSKYVGAQRNKDLSNEFVSDFFKLCTRQFNPPEVARHPLFKTFLHSLSVSN